LDCWVKQLQLMVENSEIPILPFYFVCFTLSFFFFNLNPFINHPFFLFSFPFLSFLLFFLPYPLLAVQPTACEYATLRLVSYLRMSPAHPAAALKYATSRLLFYLRDLTPRAAPGHGLPTAPRPSVSPAPSPACPSISHLSAAVDSRRAAGLPNICRCREEGHPRPIHIGPARASTGAR